MYDGGTASWFVSDEIKISENEDGKFMVIRVKNMNLREFAIVFICLKKD